ncbi:MAG: hypothetical protein MRY83_12000 [Flavobacteriales bacterium]|nr:hypothetical protein [Flavobacteriales bacterium]
MKFKPKKIIIAILLVIIGAIIIHSFSLEEDGGAKSLIRRTIKEVVRNL